MFHHFLVPTQMTSKDHLYVAIKSIVKLQIRIRSMSSRAENIKHATFQSKFKLRKRDIDI